MDFLQYSGSEVPSSSRSISEAKREFGAGRGSVVFRMGEKSNQISAGKKRAFV